MDCRKCGSKKLTRRSAGFFICQHCGVQPGPLRRDRSGNPTLIVLDESTTIPEESFGREITPVARRLRTVYST